MKFYYKIILLYLKNNNKQAAMERYKQMFENLNENQKENYQKLILNQLN